MRRKRTERTTSRTVKVLNVLVALLTIVMLIVLGRMTNELHLVFSRDPYSSIDYNLQQGNYDDMVREYYRRGYDVAPFASAHEEEYHIAQYADAAFQHQFFAAIGDAEMAQRYAGQMADAREASGSLAAVTEDIDQLLEGIRLFP